MTAAWSSPSARASSRPVAAPGGLTTTHRLARPSLVGAGESSTSSKPSTSTKKRMAGSYSPTTIAMRPRCTPPAYEPPPEPAGPEPAGPEPAGPEPAGPEPAGPQPADPATVGNATDVLSAG